jgi:hypothetical protein
MISKHPQETKCATADQYKDCVWKPLTVMGTVKYSSWIFNRYLTSFIYYNWILLNMPLRNQDVRVYTDSFSTGYSLVVDYCEHGKEGFHKM